jgi:hypothetical protein
MAKLIAKYSNRIDWGSLSEWTYNANTFSLAESDIDSRFTLEKRAVSTYDDVQNLLLIEKGKKYKISFTLAPDSSGQFNAQITFQVGGVHSNIYSAVGDYSYVMTSPTEHNIFKIRPTSPQEKWQITHLKIEEILYQEIDLFEDSLISLTFQVADIRDFAQRNTIVSRDFDIPGTEKNNKFLKNVFSINQQQKYNINGKVDAQLVLNNSGSFFTGYIQLNSINQLKDKIDYNITFVGETGNLFKSIGDDYLQDLDCPELNHQVKKNFVIDMMEFPNTTNSSTSSYVTYPFIDYGMHKEGMMRGIVGDAFDDSPSVGITVADLYPAISVHFLINKIANQYGYSIDSNWLNSDEVKSMIIPFCNKEEKLWQWYEVAKINFGGSALGQNMCEDFQPNSWDESYLTPDGLYSTNWMRPGKDGIPSYIVGVANTQQAWTYKVKDLYRKYNFTPTFASYIQTFPGQNISWIGSANEENVNGYQTSYPVVPGTYVCKKKGKYKIEIKFKIWDVPDLINSGVFLFAGKLNKEYINIQSSSITKWRNPATYEEEVHLIPNPDPSVFNNSRYKNGTFIRNYEFDCEKDDMIYFKFKTAGVTIEDIPWKGSIEYLKIYEYGWGEDCLVDQKMILPENVKIKDFLLDIIKLGHLYIDTKKGEPKTLVIEPRTPFYSKGTVLDWRDKIDMDNEITYIHPSFYSNTINKLKYKPDKDLLNAYYNDMEDHTISNDKENTGIGYGGKRFFNPSELCDGENITTLSVFSPSILRNEWRKKGVNNQIQANLTCLWNKNYPENSENPTYIEFKTDHNPRILYYRYSDFNDNNFSTYAQKTKFNFCGTNFLLKYPYAGHINNTQQLTSESTVDLNFDTRLRTQNNWQLMFNGIPNGTVTKNNVWNRYYADFFKQVTDKNARVMTANFWLNENDITSLKLNDTIQVNNSYWYINKIEDYVIDSPVQSVKVELLKVDRNVTNDYEQYETITGTTVVISTRPLIDLKLNKERVSSIGQGNITKTNSFVLGQNNIMAEKSAILNGDSNYITNKSTIINSDNVVISDGASGSTVINSDYAMVSQPNTTIIGGLKLVNGIQLNENILFDPGQDETFDITQCYVSVINDCGENNFEITDFAGPIIIIDPSYGDE